MIKYMPYYIINSHTNVLKTFDNINIANEFINNKPDWTHLGDSREITPIKKFNGYKTIDRIKIPQYICIGIKYNFK